MLHILMCALWSRLSCFSVAFSRMSLLHLLKVSQKEVNRTLGFWWRTVASQLPSSPTWFCNAKQGLEGFCGREKSERRRCLFLWAGPQEGPCAEGVHTSIVNKTSWINQIILNNCLLLVKSLKKLFIFYYYFYLVIF